MQHEQILENETKASDTETSTPKDSQARSNTESNVYLLPRLKSGKDITAIVGSAHMFHNDYDEPSTKEEANALATFIQVMMDWGARQLWKLQQSL